MEGVSIALNKDIVSALKSGRTGEAQFLRFLRSHIQNREIEKRGKGDSEAITDAETLEVLRKELKRKKESIELFQKGGREDLVLKETQELEWLMRYLPPAPTREAIAKVIQELKAKGIVEFPSMMKEAMTRLPGADGKEVSDAVKKILL